MLDVGGAPGDGMDRDGPGVRLVDGGASVPPPDVPPERPGPGGGEDGVPPPAPPPGTPDGGAGRDAGGGRDGGAGRDAGGSPPPSYPPGTDMCGDLRGPARVYHGTREPTYLSLSPGQILAIGMLDLGGGLCSGALIAPRWVLTAAHCRSSSVVFRMGADPARPDRSVRGRRFLSHSSMDIAVVELERDATEVVPEVVPIPILTEALDESWRGRDTEAAGYGRTERGSVGTRYFSRLPIAGLTGDSIHIDGRGRGGVCNGDSGGPLMALGSDGSVRVIGVVSGGDGTCTYQAWFTRVDRARSWIEGHTGPAVPPGPPPPEPCGDVTAEGRCIDGRAVYCEGGVLQRRACSSGQRCGWSAADRGYRCVRPEDDPCGGLDGFGRCEGERARWCDRGTPRTRDCAACGQRCGVVADVGGTYCAESPAPPGGSDDPCATLDYLGRCNGNVAEWCEDGEFRTRDCSATGQRCVWVDGLIGYYCR